MANRRQYPSVPSCRFSSLSFAPSYNFSSINRELVGAPCEATTVLLCALRAQIMKNFVSIEQNHHKKKNVQNCLKKKSRTGVDGGRGRGL